MIKILNGEYDLSVQVPMQCPHCKKIGMHLEDGRYGTFLSCNEFPSCTGSLGVVVKVEESIEHKYKKK